MWSKSIAMMGPLGSVSQSGSSTNKYRLAISHAKRWAIWNWNRQAQQYVVGKGRCV